MRYRTLISDSARWDRFELRAGDIVISTPPKSGTTWTQMLCALLIFDGPAFPEPFEEMSPWLDMLTRPLEEVSSAYAAQDHRRFIKTHTPLDGIPLHDDVTYVIVGRDPRDVSISMEHHQANMDMSRLIELRANAVGLDDVADLPAPPPSSDDAGERFRTFATSTAPTGLNLSKVLHHLDTAWQRRRQPNVAMFHFSDYRADLPGELSRLADALAIELTPARAAELAAEASLNRMRERADEVVPGASQGQWKNVEGFLRSGASGEWREGVSDDDLELYRQRVASLVCSDLAAWAHLGRIASGVDPAVGR